MDAVLTGRRAIPMAISAMKAGAVGFLTRPETRRKT
jgi:FixJ family two-component response regulator